VNALDPAALARRFADEARRRGFEVATLAETAAGPVIAASRDAAGPATYLSAGIHGDEPAGTLAALEMLEAGAFDDGRRWALCPLLNPVGLARGRSEDEDELDLNRDYLARRSPLVRAHVAWLEAQPRPELFLSLHEDWESRGFYFYEINLGADQPERARAILAAVAAQLPIETAARIDDHEVREPGWIHHRAEADRPADWPEAIFIAHSGCPLSFTFETPSGLPLERRVGAHRAAVRQALAEAAG